MDVNTTDGTIDITSTVEMMRSSFVTWAINFLYAAIIAVPGFGWLGGFFFKMVLNKILNWALTELSESVVMGAFFENTIIRKNSQAHDYVQAIKIKNNISPEAGDDEYEKAERAEIAAFDAFVSVTR